MVLEVDAGFDSLVSCYFDDALSAEQLKRLDDLLVQNPRCAARFHELSLVHGGLRELELCAAEGEAQAAGARLDADRQPAGRGRAPRARPRVLVPHARWLGVAAAAVLALVFGLLFPRAAREGSPAAPATILAAQYGAYVQRGVERMPVYAGFALQPADRIETSAEARATVGYATEATQIVLEADSTLSWHGSTPNKRMTLHRGALTAAVAPQPQGRPFVVWTAAAHIEVVGTRFRLETTPEACCTAVLSGAVQVTRRADGASVRAVAGESVTAAPALPLVARKRPLLPAGPVLHVSASGRADASGREDDPLSLAAAVEKALAPGTTVCLASGIYRTAPDAVPALHWTGTREARIILRSAPGAWAVLDGRLDVNKAAYVDLRDFEITRTEKDRIADNGWWDLPPEKRLPPGEENGFRMSGELLHIVRGTSIRAINLYLHDNPTGGGIGVQNYAANVLIYGCIVARVGYDDSSRGHGYACDVRNRLPGKDGRSIQRIRHCVLAYAGAVGLAATGETPDICGVRLEENAVFASGMASWTHGYSNLYVGSSQGQVDDVVISGNHFYQPDSCTAKPQDASHVLRGGIRHPGRGVVVGNRICGGGEQALRVQSWHGLEFRENILYDDKQLVDLRADREIRQGWQWDGNTYYGNGQAAPFRVDKEVCGFQTWQRATGFDAGSRWIAGRPTGVWQFILLNEFDEARATVVVYNWDRAVEVSLDLASLLHPGERFALRDALDYRGQPLVCGTYDGRSVVARVPRDEAVQGEFAVFVVHRE